MKRLILLPLALGACFHVNTLQEPRPTRPQHEITTPGDLLNADGALREKGWARSEMLRFNPERVAAPLNRLRQWEFFTILSGRYALNLTLADIGIASFCTADMIDFAAGDTAQGGIIHLSPSDGLKLTRSSGGNATCYAGGRPVATFEKLADRRVVRLDMPASVAGGAIRGKLTLWQDPHSDYLALATPFADARQFFYEQKIPNLAAEGWVTFGDRRIEFEKGKAFGIMDWGRGEWPSDLVWRWGGASGLLDGVPFGFNIGNGFGDTSAATENLFVYGGHGNKLDQVIWHYDTADYMKPWRFTSNDGRFEMDFVPAFQQSLSVDAIVKRAQLHKLYGRYSGRVILDDGRRLDIPPTMGFGEEVFIRW